MVHEVVTCDICNPQDGTKGTVKLPYPNEWRGYFDGPRSTAAQAGWKYSHISRIKGMLSLDKQDICPECQDEGKQ